MGNLFLIQCNFLVIILGIEIKYLYCILPPSYMVDLKDKQIFEISSDEDYNENENEMLQPEDLQGIESLAEDEAKYQPLHYHVENYNRQAAKKIEKISTNILFHPIIERNINEEPEPFISGFKQKLDNIKYEKPEKLHFLKKKSALEDTTVESSLKKLFFATPTNNNEGYVNNNYKRIKRSDEEDSVTDPDFFQGPNENSTPEEFLSTKEVTTDFLSSPFTELSTSQIDEFQEGKTTLFNDQTNVSLHLKESTEFREDYDYEKLKVEYYQQIEEMKRKNELFIYTESSKLEESTTNVNNKSVDVNNKSVEVKNKTVILKTPKNCTKEESSIFGFECLLNDYKHVKNASDLSKVLSKTWTITKFWIILYLCITILCWCQKGWCCCCFCCEFCYPEEVIKTEMNYFAANPPGILVKKINENGILKVETEEYKPTLFETDAYEQMESEIRNL